MAATTAAHAHHEAEQATNLQGVVALALMMLSLLFSVVYLILERRGKFAVPRMLHPESTQYSEPKRLD